MITCSLIARQGQLQLNSLDSTQLHLFIHAHSDLYLIHCLRIDVMIGMQKNRKATRGGRAAFMTKDRGGTRHAADLTGEKIAFI